MNVQKFQPLILIYGMGLFKLVLNNLITKSDLGKFYYVSKLQGKSLTFLKCGCKTRDIGNNGLFITKVPKVL